MDSPEERLSGPPATEEDGHTVIPTSPHGSATSRGSSNSRGSLHSVRSLQKAVQRRRPLGCWRYCSTVVACLVVGILITVGSVAMTVIGYFAISIASETVTSGNSSMVVLDEQLHENLFKFRTFGPVMIGFGSFLMMCACVLLCEERDKRRKNRNQASENLLSEHERIMQEARERFYNENRTTLLVETQSVDYRTPKASTNELADLDVDGHGTLTLVKPLAASAADVDNAISGSPGSPVVLVHGPTIVESIQSATYDGGPCSGDPEGRENSPANSPHSTPDHKSASLSRTLKANNSVGPLATREGLDSAGMVLPISPVLPRIDTSRGSNGASRSGGAIPKSILVPATKLSPIRSANGPVRVRLDDSPTELSPVSSPLSAPSKSAECLPQPRSPVRVKRGKRRKAAGGRQAAGRLDQCRCVSDPSMASAPRSPDQQSDACCCLQPECCWGGSCQLDASLTSSDKPIGSPLECSAGATGGKTVSPFLQPLNADPNLIAQGIELKPKSAGKPGAADEESHSSIQDKDPPLIPQSSPKPSPTTIEGQDPVIDPPPTQGGSSPSRQAGVRGKRSSAGGGDDTTVGETNSDMLVSRDRNSNVTLSSRRPEASSGKSAPTGQTKSGVTV